MTGNNGNRRQFLRTGAAVAAGYFAAPSLASTTRRSTLNRWRIGAIGMRYQGSVIAKEALEFGDLVAICDVDTEMSAKARAELSPNADVYEDYRDLLARDDVDLVTIGTPDHWHTRMLVDACRAGKHVYCEKPLTLTVDEGKQLVPAVRATGAVVQVGTWQRSDFNFRLAVEMVRAGRIGTLRKVEVVLGKNETGGPFRETAVPSHLNWDAWQGQTPSVPYIPERCHYTFRWWYEYSGGQMTDWGAHHLDIAQWGIGASRSGPIEVEGTARYPDVPDGYNVAIDYHARYRYDNGVELEVRDHGRNGVMFIGDAGRIFVNRGGVYGQPIEDLGQQPFDVQDFQVYDFDNWDRPRRTGKIDAIKNHMGNLYDCIQARRTPLADVESQHRSVTVCHLGNIAMRLGRKLRWDPENQTFPEDAEANALLSREQRPGYESIV